MVTERVWVPPDYEAIRLALATEPASRVASLSARKLEILILRHVFDLSYTDLAEALEIPKGTVMSRLSHARSGVGGKDSATVAALEQLRSSVKPGLLRETFQWHEHVTLLDALVSMHNVWGREFWLPLRWVRSARKLEVMSATEWVDKTLIPFGLAERNDSGVRVTPRGQLICQAPRPTTWFDRLRRAPPRAEGKERNCQLLLGLLVDHEQIVASGSRPSSQILASTLDVSRAALYHYLATLLSSDFLRGEASPANGSRFRRVQLRGTAAGREYLAEVVAGRLPPLPKAETFSMNEILRQLEREDDRAESDHDQDDTTDLLEDELAEPPYEPDGLDDRSRVLAEQTVRPNQAVFRRELIARHGTRCLVTGECPSAAIDAAHICDYRGERDNHMQNGLLLRADVHRLFDRELIGIEPGSLRLHIHPRLLDTRYAELAGTVLWCAHPLSERALAWRWTHFVQGPIED